MPNDETPMAMNTEGNTSASIDASYPRELAAGRVFQLGGDIVLDEQISWWPGGLSRPQPLSCYLIRGRSGSVLIDSGVRLHAGDIVAQLDKILDPQEPLAIVLTRTEMECCLNIPLIEEHRVVESVWYTGGITVPRSHAVPQRIALDPGNSTLFEPMAGVELELISPLLRLLPTLWVFDNESGVLMTSDGFTHGQEAVSDPRDGLVKFSWFAEADTRAIAQDVRDIVGQRSVQTIAPSYGVPIVGEDRCRSEAARMAGEIQTMGLQ